MEWYKQQNHSFCLFCIRRAKENGIVHKLDKGNCKNQVKEKKNYNANNWGRREAFNTENTSLLWLESQSTNPDHFSFSFILISEIH